jgi:hypothetical protein
MRALRAMSHGPCGAMEQDRAACVVSMKLCTRRGEREVLKNKKLLLLRIDTFWCHVKES